MTDIAALLAELDTLREDWLEADSIQDAYRTCEAFSIRLRATHPALRAEIERLTKENAYLKAGIKWRSP